MKLNIYSIFDSATNAFITPFFTTNDNTAKRSFQQAANDPSHHFHLHAADYTLFHLGTFDQDRGTHSILPSAINLGNALTFINNSPLVLESDAAKEETK